MTPTQPECKCPHCHQPSADAEYCEHCDLPMVPAPPCAEPSADEYLLDHEPRDDWFQHELPAEFVQRPIEFVRQGSRWLLRFPCASASRLPDYLQGRRVDGRLPFDVCVPLLEAAFQLFAAVHAQDCLVGDLVPAAVLVHEDSPGALRLQLRQTRPFLSGKTPVSAEAFASTRGHDAPEVRNGQAELWSVRSDVFVLGSFLVGLLTGRAHFEDFAELEHLAHQVRVFAPSAPVQLHPWLARACSPNPARRFQSTAVQCRAFRRLLRRARRRLATTAFGLKVGGGGTSRMGIGKIKDEDDFRPESEVNQDRHLLLWGCEDQREVLAVVADGITRARHGSGSQAAEITCTALEQAWQERRLTTPNALLDALREINERIVGAAAAQASGVAADELASSDLMGATAAVCMVRDGRAHLVSCGDARAYLWSTGDGLLLLTPDHNQLNRDLLAGESWTRAHERESNEALTSHLGCGAIVEDRVASRCPDFHVETVPLRAGDLLVLCTDGLTDFLGGLYGGKGRWDAEAVLSRCLGRAARNRVPIKRLVEELVDKANRNGGGDNITTVILRIVEANPLTPGEKAEPARRGGKRSRHQKKRGNDGQRHSDRGAHQSAAADQSRGRSDDPPEAVRPGRRRAAVGDAEQPGE